MSPKPRVSYVSAFILVMLFCYTTDSLITIQNLVAVSHTVYAHVEALKFGGRWDPAP